MDLDRWRSEALDFQPQSRILLMFVDGAVHGAALLAQLTTSYLRYLSQDCGLHPVSMDFTLQWFYCLVKMFLVTTGTFPLRSGM